MFNHRGDCNESPKETEKSDPYEFLWRKTTNAPQNPDAGNASSADEHQEFFSREPYEFKD